MGYGSDGHLSGDHRLHCLPGGELDGFDPQGADGTPEQCHKCSKLNLGVATSVIGGITTTALGLIFSVYILAQKEKLGMQAKKIVYAYLPTKWVNRVLKVFHISNKTFSGFISGQCTEAVVFGCFCYLGMVLFRFPYALSISVLIGFLTLIPIVGAFLGTALGAILIMVTSPLRAVWFVVLIIVLQQIDGNLIYPRIVGNSVGLPGIWVMMAVTVGGSLMGILGMLVLCPFPRCSTPCSGRM